MVGLERFPDKQSFQRYQVRLQAAWEQFMSGESRTPDPSVVPFRIAESWKRSQGYGLDPFHYQSFVKMKKTEHQKPGDTASDGRDRRILAGGSC